MTQAAAAAAVSLLAEQLESAASRLCPGNAHLARAVTPRFLQHGTQLVSSVCVALTRARGADADAAAVLAAAFLRELFAERGEATQALRRLVASGQADDAGRLFFLTRRAADAGALVCPSCAHAAPGKRALRSHLQTLHALSIEQSVAAVAAASAAAAACSQPAAPPPLPDALALCRDGDLDSLTPLLETGDSSLFALDRHGCSALHWAAGCGHEALCRRLLQAGLSATATCALGRTPLHWAARKGQLSICRFLVEEQGCPPDAATKDGTTPLHLAVWQGEAAVSAWLASFSGWAGTNSFACGVQHWAAMGSGSLEVLSLMDASGEIEWGAVNGAGHTALHKAAARGEAAAVGWLLRRWPSALEARDREGCTALQLAALWGRAEAVALLLGAGAGGEEEAAAMAESTGHAALAELLRRAGGAARGSSGS